MSDLTSSLINRNRKGMSPLLDGCKIGINMTSQVGGENAEIEYNKLVEIFKSKSEDVFTDKNGLVGIYVQGAGSKARLSCSIFRNMHWIWLDGNPISFESGQNMIGNTNVCRQLLGFIREIETRSEIKLPHSVEIAMANLDIHISLLAFAGYTPDLCVKGTKNLSKFVGVVNHLYHSGSIDGTPTLEKYLNCKVRRDGSQSIRFERKSSNSKNSNGAIYCVLSMYNKEIQMRPSPVPEEIKGRLRLDLTLRNEWFRQNNLTKLHLIDSRYGRDYTKWMVDLINKEIKETRLNYLLTFPILNKIQTGEFDKEYNRWKNGAKIENVDAIEWFINQNLDVSLTYKAHSQAHFARTTVGVPMDIRDALLDGNPEGPKMLAKYLEGDYNKQFLPVARRAKRLCVDQTFPRFSIRPGTLISIETGESVEIQNFRNE